MINLSDKFLIADVFDVVALNPKTKKPIMVEEDNSDVSWSLKSSIKEIKTGQMNKLFATLRSKEAPEITMTTPKMSLESIAQSLGQEIITGTTEGITKTVKERLDSSLKITLTRVPKNPDKLEIYVGKDLLSKDTDYTYTTGSITFKGSKAVEGEVILIAPYIFATSEKASKIKIDATSFPDGVELWLTTFAINKTDKKEGLLQIKFYEAVASGEIDWATKSDRDAVQTKVTYKAVAGEDDNYGDIIFIPIDTDTP